ncbi:MAG: HAD family hydrolase [Candidatus Omnitrophota bacterium]|nr:HAD family hydrolase [Candidatus Omnitrophota bacterium]
MKVIFLDRDGVINRYPGDKEYVKSWKEFQFLPGVRPALKKLCLAGFKLYIVSNQAGVGKKIYTRAALDEITRKMLRDLMEYGVEIAGVGYCTHRPEEECLCRKPKAGLIDAVVEKLRRAGKRIDLKKSFFIGDTIRDIQAGKEARLKTILVFSGKEKQKNKSSWRVVPDLTAQDLAAAADYVCKNT